MDAGRYCLEVIDYDVTYNRYIEEQILLDRDYVLNQFWGDLEDPVLIAGTVRDANGNPLSNVMVYVEHWELPFSNEVYTDSNGHYSVNVYQGEHWLYLLKSGYEHQWNT